MVERVRGGVFTPVGAATTRNAASGVGEDDEDRSLLVIRNNAQERT